MNRLFGLARTKAFKGDLFDNLIVSDELTQENTFEFKAGIHPVRKPYRGSYKFNKHFYAQIDDLREKTDSGAITEEFKCAQLLDFHPKVKHWVRNIPKSPSLLFGYQLTRITSILISSLNLLPDLYSCLSIKVDI